MLRRLLWFFLAASSWDIAVLAVRFVPAWRSHSAYRGQPLLDGLKDWPPR